MNPDLSFRMDDLEEIQGFLTKIFEEYHFLCTVRDMALLTEKSPMATYTVAEARSSDVLHYRMPSLAEDLRERARVSLEAAKAVLDAVPVNLKYLPHYPRICRQYEQCDHLYHEVGRLVDAVQANYALARQA